MPTRTTRTTTALAVIIASAAALLALAALTHASDPDPTPASPAPAPPAPAAPAKKDAPAPASTAPTAPPAAKPADKPADNKDASPAPSAPAVSPYVLDFKVKRIDGTEEDLSIYRGKVVLIVNVASKCGFTKQYEGLQKLYESKKDAGGAEGSGGGLVILGFPANDFRGQEPGSNKEIAEFCTSRFHVTFPMFEKITVTGKDAHPLYQRLAAQPAPVGGEGVPGWNFTKFLIDRQGNVVARFDSKVAPDDAALVQKIDALIAEKK